MRPAVKVSRGRKKRQFPPAGPASTARSRSRAILCAWAALLLAAAFPSRGDAAEPGPRTFRIGVSHRSFLTVTLDDARAAIRVWVDTVSRERGLDVDAQVEVFENEQDLYRAFAAGNVDASSMTVEEFFAISQHADFVYRPARASGYTESYVVLARGKAGVDHLRGLKGRKLVRHVHPATGPALPWLETLLAELGLDRAVDFFGETSEVESPSKAVLRVFFGQADACLVTSEAFDVACELNPQLRKELRVLATSPAVVPSVFVFRTGYESPVRRELEAAILSLHSTPAGQQVLTVFQATRMEKLPFSALETTRQLFERYDRLIGKRESVTGAVGLSKGGSRP